MDSKAFWTLITDARASVADPTDCCAVVARATTLLAAFRPAEIVAAHQTLWDLMSLSYRNPLWAAAYVINGGCSDDGFEYFRGWLLTQGEETFHAAIASPDSLAGLPVVVAAAESGTGFDCEYALGIAYDAHQQATGMRLPEDAFTIDYPDIDLDWHFDFGDDSEVARRLPRLTALFDA